MNSTDDDESSSDWYFLSWLKLITCDTKLMDQPNNSWNEKTDLLQVVCLTCSSYLIYLYACVLSLSSTERAVRLRGLRLTTALLQTKMVVSLSLHIACNSLKSISALYSSTRLLIPHARIPPSLGRQIKTEHFARLAVSYTPTFIQELEGSSARLAAFTPKKELRLVAEGPPSLCGRRQSRGWFLGVAIE